jgi:glycosyltransferase involved in cell wall biosynthesis
MARVSVIISTYNHANYVEECVQSVLDQTFNDFELIIVNNGSTDHTSSALQKFDDSRIRIYNLIENRGAGVGFTHAAEQASGEFISPLSSDDAFEPTKLMQQVGFMDAHKECAAVFAYPVFIDEYGCNITDAFHKDANVFFVENRNRIEWLNHFFYNGNCLCFPSALIRREVYQKIKPDPRLRQLADFDMWVHLVSQHELHIIQKPLVRFRVRNGLANESAARTDVIIRHVWEIGRILPRYTNITPHDFSLVFKEKVPANVGVALAKRALQVDHPAYRAFGLNLWYESIGGNGDEDYPSFYNATGFYDVYKVLDLPRDFDGGRYLDLNPDVKEHRMDPGVHFSRYGKFEGRTY